MRLVRAVLGSAVLGLTIGPREPRVLGPYSAAANFAADILGDLDVRPNTWGRAGSHEWKITFSPPPGYRVRILRVYGDVLAWPRGTVDAGRFAGVLFGLRNSGPDGSVRADWAADNTFLYLQSATGGEVARAAFDHVVAAGGLLAPDHVLCVKVAVWLNDTGRHIHIEPTFTMVYQFEKECSDGNSLRSHQPLDSV